VESARRQGETAIGYRDATARNDPPHYGIVLNPGKTDPIVLGERDSVIVLAEH
jgi:hypothetical protein